MRLRSILALGFALALGMASGPAHAQPLSAVRIASGLAAPMFVTAPPGDPRLFVLERAGRIRIVSGDAVLPAPYLDITARVRTQGEGGLLGLAFAPDFAESGHFYVYYTAPDDTAPGDLESRVSRFTAVGVPASSNDADENSEVLLFSIDQPYDNHNGGTIAIRDGWLYLALGDGGSGGDPEDRAQDDGSLLGKMLRFDLSIPNPDTQDWQVWAKGFRNPFRFSFDRTTGDLYVGDVGQNTREEIDAERADFPGGGNYGWDVEEGTTCHEPDDDWPPCGSPLLIEPIFDYEHSGNSCSGSVTGGAVYRGSASPVLRGLYFFADYCKNRIWSLRWNRDTNEVSDVDERTGEITTDVGTIASVVAIGEDAAGELLFVDPGGEVFRLVPEPGAGALGTVAVLALGAARARRRITGQSRPGC